MPSQSTRAALSIRADAAEGIGTLSLSLVWLSALVGVCQYNVQWVPAVLIVGGLLNWMLFRMHRSTVRKLIRKWPY
jgi:hypothetical protein